MAKENDPLKILYKALESIQDYDVDELSFSKDKNSIKFTYSFVVDKD